MPSTPSAKYSRAGHPAMRQMLGPERVSALEHALALLDLQLAVVQPGGGREELDGKREEVRAALRGAMKLQR